MSRKVFVGGSIRLRSLPSSVKDMLDAEIASSSSFLVGDAPGVDTEVQEHLQARDYRDVTIYAMDRTRNNVGGWQVKNHRAPAGTTGGGYYAIKDREMDNAADAGIMIWDGSSRGTKNNIIALLSNGKPCAVHDGQRLRAYKNLQEFENREKNEAKMSEQQSLFEPAKTTVSQSGGAIEKDAGGISGLTIVRGWLPAQARTTMLATIDSRTWSSALKRRTQHEGWKYSYDRRPLREDDYLGPLPGYLEAVVARLKSEMPHLSNIGEQAIVNNYERGEGINTHIDHVGNFGPEVVSVSLGSAVMEFARGGKSININLDSGDMCVMEGDARYKWTHAIKGHEARRVSVTFRSIADRELVKKMTQTQNTQEATFEEIGGDIWEVGRAYGAICVTTNGIIKSNGLAVMGAGIAKSARDQFPGIDKTLAEGLNKNGNHVQIIREVPGEPLIVAFPTKHDYRDDSDPELIRRSCKELVALTNERGITALMTRPGTTNGKLDWESTVKPILNKELAGSSITVIDFNYKKETTMEKTLFDTPAERPPVPEPGQWHQNWFSNMRPYDAPRKRADGLIAHTPEHDYQIEKTTDPVMRRLIADLGTVDKFGKPIPHERVTGHIAKKFWKELAKAGGEIMITEASLSKWGLPKSWIAENDLSVPGPERVGDYIVIKGTERPDWREVREAHMLNIQRHRFAPGTAWCDKLMATGRTQICEWNNWGDKTWGRDIRTGEGLDKLGEIVMIVREENRERGVTSTLPSPENEKKPGWLLPHITGKKNMSEEIGAIGAGLKEIDSASCGIKDATAYHATKFVTVVGSRKIADDPEKMLWMEWTARTFAESGFVIRSGGAEGADTAAEAGAKASKAGTAALEIAHPYDRPSKGSRDPGNYVLREGPLKALAHEYIRGVTGNFDSVSQPARDLQGRDFVQVYGKDGKTPSDAVFYCAPEPKAKMYDKEGKKGEIESGTRFAVYSARGARALGFESIPDHNLETDREAYRDAVIALANEQRAVIGKKPLPEDWSPSHESYLKVTGRDAGSLADREAESANKMLDEKKEQEAAMEAQAAARRLMGQMKTLLAGEGNGPQFKALENRSIEGEILAMDGRVMAIKDLKNPGEYTLADLNRTQIEDGLQVGATVKVKRGANGLVEVTAQQMEMSSSQSAGRVR